MKFFIALVFIVACNDASTVTPKKPEPKATQTEQAGILPGDVKNAQGKSEEDCDDKAKKPIEIKAETISLSGNTGCSLDEAAAQKP